MARRALVTIAFLLLAAIAFASADVAPDINLFGVLFLFFAFVVWFYWKDIMAGYAYLDDRGPPPHETCGLILLRFAPMYLRELTARKPRRSK